MKEKFNQTQAIIYLIDVKAIAGFEKVVEFFVMISWDAIALYFEYIYTFKLYMQQPDDFGLVNKVAHGSFWRLNHSTTKDDDDCKK